MTTTIPRPTAPPVARHTVLDCGDPACGPHLDRLRAAGAVWSVDDTLDAQLADLARTRSRNPGLDGDALLAAVEGIRDGVPAELYGRWVHFPWSGRLVRLLPPAEFRELRSDRNRHKLTDEEQARLRTLAVGIVGLSVGNAIALTIALEGAFGELRLADHDHLDLSNLNRLRATVHDLGLGKAQLAARQIAEIDPYATVRIVEEGVTADNVDAFLDGLDVVVEECDHFPVKLLVRERARAHGIPVLMETSDRGMLDVERFDEEPDRPLFHGLAGSAADSAALAAMGPEEQLLVGLRVIAPETLSDRMLASMVERGQSVSTWPQLAAEVTLGGATIATAIRRIGLGLPLASGRLRIDLDALLGNPAREAVPPSAPPVGPADPGGPTIAADARTDLVAYVVEHAILAPSGGNAQPWHFVDEGTRLLVARDPTRATGLLDGSGHATLLSLGAALENIAIAAAAAGRHAAITPFPDPGRDDIVAAVDLSAPADEDDRARAAELPLVVARATNRHAGTRAPLSDDDRGALVAAADAGGAHLQLHTDDARLAEAAAILGEADRLRLLCPELHRDAMAELRGEGDDLRTGIDVATLELTPIERMLFVVASRPAVVGTLRAIDGGAAIQAGAWKAMAGAGAVGALAVRSPTPEGWLRAGRALQRTWLAATARGLALQPMSALVFMLGMPARTEVLSAAEQVRIAALGQRLAMLFDATEVTDLALVFRLTRAPAPTRRSQRLPVASVLTRSHHQED